MTCARQTAGDVPVQYGLLLRREHAVSSSVDQMLGVFVGPHRPARCAPSDNGHPGLSEPGARRAFTDLRRNRPARTKTRIADPDQLRPRSGPSPWRTNLRRDDILRSLSGHGRSCQGDGASSAPSTSSHRRAPALQRGDVIRINNATAVDSYARSDATPGSAPPLRGGAGPRCGGIVRRRARRRGGLRPHAPRQPAPVRATPPAPPPVGPPGTREHAH